MKTNNIYIAQPSNSEQVTALEAFMKALKIKFEVRKDLPYDPLFVDKVQQGDTDFKAGKGRKVTIDELNKLWK
ncbi:MAG TPA: hypothetical protein PKL43_08850 [Bacteroidales bacterium]|jgi:hypothetical protein|nr:hypothetical protein [Bacteroidales bacterium]